MSEATIPAQGPVDVLVGRLRTHAEAHEYIANADPEQKQWMNDLYDAANALERRGRRGGLKMSVKQENRYRKLVISQGRAATDRQREVEAACMERGTRKPALPPPPSARRRDVRAWMRHNAEHYETATELAADANAIFQLPDGGLDDETHWVWDEAAEAIDYT